MASAEGGLSKSQKKKLKKKRAAERAEQEGTGTGCGKADSALAAAASDEVPATPELTFSVDEEILWCVLQLKQGLKSNEKAHRNPKSAEHVQTSSVLKLIATLQSPTTPLPKKRQLMRGNFGDYRAKMRAAFKAQAVATNAEDLNLHPADAQAQASGKFYRQSRHVQESAAAAAAAAAAATSSESSEPLESSAPQAAAAKAEDAPFRFNFGDS